jgi:hypothetical protein
MTELAVSFRNADLPRPLATRLIAAARRHPRGWSLTIPETGSTQHVTFEATVEAVTEMTGVRRLLIVWSFEAETPDQDLHFLYAGEFAQ